MIFVYKGQLSKKQYYFIVILRFYWQIPIWVWNSKDYQSLLSQLWVFHYFSKKLRQMKLTTVLKSIFGWVDWARFFPNRDNFLKTALAFSQLGIFLKTDWRDIDVIYSLSAALVSENRILMPCSRPCRMNQHSIWYPQLWQLQWHLR